MPEATKTTVGSLLRDDSESGTGAQHLAQVRETGVWEPAPLSGQPLSPATVFVGWLLILTVLYLGRRWFVRPAVAAITFVLSLVFLAVSLCDPRFAAAVLSPEGIPVVAMLYLFAFFTWLATAQAVANDRPGPGRQSHFRGDERDSRDDGSCAAEIGTVTRAPMGKERRRRVFVWPDLVYSELICMVLVTTLLLAFSLLVPAPLEELAHPAVTPNPSKAPWYFVGLQEMLYYADARLTGPLVPCLLVLGLMAIPYLDRNPAGNGCYTIARRRFAYLAFQIAFWQFWILAILMGTFFRGPDWRFLVPYQVGAM